MKNHYKLICSVSFILVLLVISSFTTKIHKGELPKKVALISVYIDRYIDEWGFDSMGNTPGQPINVAVGPFYSKVRDGRIIDHSAASEELKKTIFSAASKFPFELVPENDVIGNKDYQALSQSPGIRGAEYSRTPATSYLPIVTTDRFTIRDFFKTSSPDIDGALFVDLHYTLRSESKDGDEGIASITADIYVQAKNKEGKKVWKIFSHGKSKSRLYFLYSKMFSEAELEPLCAEAFDAALSGLEGKIAAGDN